MKPYQDHCEIKDKGKATPHPKAPTTYSYRGQFRHYHSPKKQGDGTYICKKCKNRIERNEAGGWKIVK